MALFQMLARMCFGSVLSFADYDMVNLNSEPKEVACFSNLRYDLCIEWHLASVSRC
jgi:hypothetical protein